MADKTDQKDFLNRWSARKLDAADAEKAAAVIAVAEPDELVPEEPATPDAPPPDLPDVETLDAGSDFTAFLGDNVPRDIAKLAFRKLWRSDPVLANIDGLNDYDEDYSMLGKVAEVFKSAYQVGKGYASEDDDKPDEDEDDAQEVPEAETAENEQDPDLDEESADGEAAEPLDEVAAPPEGQPTKV